MSRGNPVYCLLLILLSVSLGNAQSLRSDKWLKENDRGNRSEGSYFREYSSATELVSFIGSFEPYSIGQGQKLAVKFYLPKADNFYLKAEEIQPMNNYWMEHESQAPMGWQLFDNWPVDEWLGKLEVQASNLGVLVQMGSQESNLVAPALVFYQNIPAYLDRYIAKYRLGTAISKGSYKVLVGKHEGRLPTGRYPIHQGVVYQKNSGSFFNILIPRTKLSREAWYTVFVRLEKYNSTDVIYHQFSFYHYPKLD